jgi:hypothetical protein
MSTAQVGAAGSSARSCSSPRTLSSTSNKRRPWSVAEHQARSLVAFGIPGVLAERPQKLGEHPPGSTPLTRPAQIGEEPAVGKGSAQVPRATSAVLR